VNDPNPAPSDSRIPLQYAGPTSRVASGNRRRFIISIWILGAATFILAGILFWDPKARSAPPAQHQCAGNMRQIGTACAIYAVLHEGNYPRDLGVLLSEIDLPASIFVCPNTPDTPAAGPTTRAVVNNMMLPGHHSYIYLGKGLTLSTASPDVILLYEPLSDHANTGMNVLFADGHDDWLSPADAQPLLKQVAAGTWPVRLPPATAPASQPSP
jgi:prepilin-type processing-associated H-X9-DG protein